MSARSKIEHLLQLANEGNLDHLGQSYELDELKRISASFELRTNLLVWSDKNLRIYSKQAQQFLQRSDVNKGYLENADNAEPVRLVIEALVTGFCESGSTVELRDRGSRRKPVVRTKDKNQLLSLIRAKIGQKLRSGWTGFWSWLWEVFISSNWIIKIIIIITLVIASNFIFQKIKAKISLPVAVVSECGQGKVRSPNWNSDVVGTIPDWTKVKILDRIKVQDHDYTPDEPGCDSDEAFLIRYAYIIEGKKETIDVWILGGDLILIDE